jgi:hypothetical protein
MGATNFSIWATGESLSEAYDTEVAQANYEHGHNAYNGTIATTSRVKLNYPPPGVTTERELLDYLEDNFDMLHRACTKWETCRAFVSPENPNRWLIFGWAAT